MARVYQGERILLERPLGWLERLIYRLLGPSARTEQDWKSYGKTTIVFSFVFFVFLYVILRTQNIHPFNPEGFNSAPWDVTFNTTSSFITNTNWQYYGGETTMTYFSQMAGLAVQNFVSAAVGMAVLAAVIRGFASRGVKELGNFWRDVTRTLLYILLPLAAVGTLILVSQGVSRTSPLRQLHRPRAASIRRSRWAPPPPRRRSSSSAPTAAASSTSTAPSRSRTRRSSRASSR